jgi:hypothetical protein
MNPMKSPTEAGWMLETVGFGDDTCKMLIISDFHISVPIACGRRIWFDSPDDGKHARSAKNIRKKNLQDLKKNVCIPAEPGGHSLVVKP